MMHEFLQKWTDSLVFAHSYVRSAGGGRWQRQRTHGLNKMHQNATLLGAAPRSSPVLILPEKAKPGARVLRCKYAWYMVSKKDGYCLFFFA